LLGGVLTWFRWTSRDNLPPVEGDQVLTMYDRRTSSVESVLAQRTSCAFAWRPAGRKNPGKITPASLGRHSCVYPNSPVKSFADFFFCFFPNQQGSLLSSPRDAYNTVTWHDGFRPIVFSLYLALAARTSCGIPPKRILDAFGKQRRLFCA